MPEIKALSQKVIYIYQHIDVTSHIGWLKVGETTKETNDRIRSQNEADNVEVKILWETEAIRNNGKTFSDKDIHRLLETKGIEREKKKNTNSDRYSEWFKIELELLKQYIQDYKDCIVSNEQGEITEYTLRTEQQKAIDETKAYFEKTQIDKNLQPKFLWNAKPRFGKTLTAYEYIKSVKALRVIIITNRPAIADSWFKDYKEFIKPTTDFVFSSSDSIAKSNNEILTRDDVLKQNLADKPQIYFISLQDVKGQGYSNNSSNITKWKEKNKWIFELSWDLLIIDESHEGVETIKTSQVIDNLKQKFTLHLSGTPFKAIQGNKFSVEQIYNWSYADEQKMKKEWSVLDGKNPYASLPKLNIFTYKLSRALEITAEKAKEEGGEYAFDLGEFFNVVNNKFVYENEINKFLNNLCNPSFEYPFSKSEYLESLRHTFWLLPGVKQCEQMKKLLLEHNFFKDYQIIFAAGEGDDDRKVKTALQEVKDGIAGKYNNPLKTKTITLSCGQLTTGVTIRAWTAVIMLNNCKSPALYMQSAFRAQTPFEFEGKIKTDCFVFDFAPDRVLQTIAEFANNMQGKSSASPDEKNVKTLLNFLAVIAEDDTGKMKELDANEVLTIPLKFITQEIVIRGFMSNRLFENISGIFGAPRSVMEIIEKMNPEINGRLGDYNKNIPSQKIKIWLDDSNRVHIGEDIIVNTTNGLLGDKKYVIEDSPEGKELKEIINDIKIEMQNKNVSQETQRTILKTIENKMPKIVKNEPTEEEKANLSTPSKPDEKPKNNEKSEEDKIRDRLRGFTRTIPSFLMAYGNNNTLLATFEQNIPPNVFEELTSITIDEFKQLRDGFDYQENGISGHFKGLFDEDVFNASIKLFLKKREELANYFKNPSDDIFDYIPPQETNQIFTPKRVVKMIVDCLQNEHPELFENTKTTFCDLYMKSGLFIAEIVRRLFEKTHSQYSNDDECIKHILENQVYGFSPTDILYNICINLIFGFDSKNNLQAIKRSNFAKIDTVPYCKSGTLTTLKIGNSNMKFDVIIGNPPYQMSDGGGTGDSAIPIYNNFIEQAKSINPKFLVMIIPSRWMKGGKGLDNFRKEMINDRNIRFLHDFETSTECFPKNHIDGGVCYFLRDRDNEGKCKYIYQSKDGQKRITERYLKTDKLDTVIRDFRQQSIIEKAIKNPPFFSSIVSVRKPYGFSACTFNKPQLYGLSDIPEIPFKNSVKIYGVKGKKGGAKRVFGYIEKKNITNKNVDKYKLFFSKAYMTTSTVPPKIIEAQPNEICTETFLEIGGFENKQQASNCLSYIRTKFFRALLFYNRHSLNISRSSFDLIPMQDFNKEWIDKELYIKYDLTKQEIDFIEKNIMPMNPNDNTDVTDYFDDE